MTLLDASPKKDFIACVSTARPGVAKSNQQTPVLSIAMKLHLFSGFTAALCVLLASCYPVEENPQRKKANQAAQKPTAEQLKQQEEQARKKQEEELRKTQETATGGVTETPRETGPSQQTTSPPVEQKRTDYPFANKVPGKEGFVFSPYNNKVIEVRDDQGKLIPTGTLVQDPTFPASEKKFFRVP